MEHYWVRVYQLSVSNPSLTAEGAVEVVTYTDHVRALAEVQAKVNKLELRRTPTHGTCCTCQRCGMDYDSCRCSLDDAFDEVDTLQAQVTALTQERDAAVGACVTYLDRITELVTALDVERERADTAEKIVRDLCEQANVHHPDCIIRDLKQERTRREEVETQLRLCEAQLADEQTAYKKLSEQWNKADVDLAHAQEALRLVREGWDEAIKINAIQREQIDSLEEQLRHTGCN